MCPQITYFRVVDRLGVGRGPQVQVVRGGIRYKYVVLRLRSGYNLPISVNIYVGCENKMTRAKTTLPSTTHRVTTSTGANGDLTSTVYNDTNATTSDNATASVTGTTVAI